MLAAQLNQTAVYWGSPQDDGYGGRFFASGVEIPTRWHHRQELFVDAEGREQRSHAVVYVSSDLDIGGYLYLGTLASLSSAQEGDPLLVAAAYEIRAVGKSPNLRADKFTRKIWL